MTHNKSHKEQIERWVEFIKENPTKWKRIHTDFINAQIEMALRAREKMKNNSSTPKSN